MYKAVEVRKKKRRFVRCLISENVPLSESEGRLSISLSSSLLSQISAFGVYIKLSDHEQSSCLNL